VATLFKDRLREWRGKRRQKEAAEILNVPLGTYRTWEYGKRTPRLYLVPIFEGIMAANQENNNEH
jgi:hypothetical protein